jgi:hypothetical protein
MSQRTLKSQNRYIRKLHRQSYEATIAGMAESDAKIQVLRSYLRPKPRFMANWAWHLIQKVVIKLPK